MREETNVEYRWSAEFWLKKALWLIGALAAAWLIWWLWDYDANETPDTSSDNNAVVAVDTDNDGINDDEDDDDDGDGYSDVDEKAAGTDTLDATKYPAKAAEEPADDGLPFSVDVPGFTGEPTASSNGTKDCVYTYAYGSGSSVTVYDSCLPSTLGNTDWVWTHNSSAKVTSAPTAYDCAGAELVDSKCTHGNGVYEVWSMDSATQTAVTSSSAAPSEYVVFEINDKEEGEIAETTSKLTAIIESFTRN